MLTPEQQAATTAYDDRDTTESDAYDTRVIAEARAWVARWPNHCAVCLGAGVFITRNYPHAPDDVDPCVALPHYQCHRCKLADPAIAYTVVEFDDGSREESELNTSMQRCPRCGWAVGFGPDDVMPQC